MFRSLSKSLFQSRRRIVNGQNSKPLLFLCSHLTSQNPSFLHIKVRFLSSSSLNQNNNDSSSGFVVSYLMNSCGLTEKQALSASKKLNFKTTSNPDRVVTLFEAHGFTKPDISKIITKNPMILEYPHKILKPKFDYFSSKDITGLDLAKVLSTNPLILYRSIERLFVPFFEFVKKIVGTDRHVFHILQRTCIPADVYRKLMHNIKVLRHEGVPQSSIVKFLINQPRLFMMGTGKFKEIVQEVKGMGFDPYKFAFHSAIHVIASMTKSTWEKKFNAYRKWGWSEEQIQFAFMLHPQCIRHSEKKISTTMDYLVNQMGISSLLMAKCPTILDYSLDKRIIPRLSVYQILVSKGLINKDQICITTLLRISNESFLEKFVIKYEEEAPELKKDFTAIMDAEDTG